MSETLKTALAAGLLILWCLAMCSVIGGIAFVAVHFIIKFW